VTIAVGIKQLFFEDGGSSRPAVTQPAGRIVFPASGEAVSRDISARGTLSDVPEASHVWLAVRDGSFLFPQGAEILASDERWKLDFRQAGSSATIGLELLLMGDGGDRFIRDRLAAGNFAGISRIPGAKVLDAVESLTVR
jgi:hypothetical protein